MNRPQDSGRHQKLEQARPIQRNRSGSGNPFLEVGDPQGNGPEYSMFPVIPVQLNGFVYHLQDVVMLPWFTGEVPSSAQNGWYDFPGKTQILAPAVLCNP